MIVDEFARDFYVDMTKSITVKDKRKYSDVQMTSYKSSYLPFQQQYGSFNQGGQYPILKEGLEFGLYADEDGNGDYSSNLGYRWKLTDNINLKTTAGFMNEQTNWLGNQTDGALAVGKNNVTQFGQVGIEYSLGKNLFSFDAGRGWTDVNTVSKSLITDVSRLQTQSYKLGFERAIDHKSRWGATYSLPSRITKGSANLNVPYATTLAGEVVYDNVRADLTQSTPEKNFGVYYNHRGETDLEWKTTFSLEYRQNVAGVSGDNKFVPALQVSKKFWGACVSLFGMQNERPGCQRIRAEEKLALLLKEKNKDAEIAELRSQLVAINQQIAVIHGKGTTLVAKKVNTKEALSWSK
jgi:hypothetical protein